MVFHGLISVGRNSELRVVKVYHRKYWRLRKLSNRYVGGLPLLATGYEKVLGRDQFVNYVATQDNGGDGGV